ncbi:proteasome complex subunit Rpn13 ubiquitin receptor-domain-containing protein [Lipomyces japonicus]|uniref:proteasome complex subunit Rpn13 ubiquitin receptor-domain-containing protein n=1 Tax=Lipomyces japonicus TaxID=56871 RepID=UPI0034CD3089
MPPSTTLLTFKAGRFEFNPPSKTLRPLPQKGKITLSRPSGGGDDDDDDDEDDIPLLSFVWEPRGSSKTDASVEPDELTIFPGEAEWVHVSSCPTGRVYVLKFNSSSQRIFFWLQDPPVPDGKLSDQTESDKVIFNKVNTYLENVFATTTETTTAEPAASGDVEMVDQEPEQSSSSSGQPNLSALLQSITIPATDATTAELSTSASSTVPILNFTDAITPVALANYVSFLPESELSTLYDFLPPTIERSRPELLRVLQSPQFLQGLNSLGDTLRQSFQAGSNVGQVVAAEFGIPYAGEGIEAFLRAILASLNQAK